MTAAALSTRTHILDAAATVILREGVGCLTLERVAREAGISKGGLLYHFKAKDTLIEALIQRLITHFDDRIQTFEHDEPRHPGRHTRAFVRTAVDDSGAFRGSQYEGTLKTFAALLAGVISNPRLLDPLRKKYAEWLESLETDGVSRERATVIRLAADGLWFLELFQLVRFSPQRKRLLMQEMLDLTSAEERLPQERGKK